MSDQAGPSSGPSNGGNSTTPSRAVPSLAKKQGDVTRMGAQKLKFVPTLPARRKKEESKEEPTVAPTGINADRGRGRGRGEPRARGRGRGGEGRGGREARGDPPRLLPVEMTASGPFAMGPAMAGMSAHRTIPRQGYTPVMPQGPGATQKPGAGLTQTTAPTLGMKREPGESSSEKSKEKQRAGQEDEEVYSDPDEGVEILDMDKIRTMDWMAPDTLRKEKQPAKKKVKKEEKDVKGKGVAREKPPSIEVGEEDGSKVNLANAVHLSDSEEEEEMEDIIDDFVNAMYIDPDIGLHQEEQLYFFQFPHPLPTFLSKLSGSSAAESAEQESAGNVQARNIKTGPLTGKPVPAEGSAAADGDATTKVLTDAPKKMDGVVGQLEVYRSGAVKMRIGKDILLDVTAGTQPSFLQHAVYVDPETKRLCVLGAVQRRFVVSPDLDALLQSIEQEEQQKTTGTEMEAEGPISMDTT